MSVPEPHGVNPWQFEEGDRFNVTIVGRNLRDVDAVDLGPQVIVERFFVDDPNENDSRIIAKIKVEEIAVPGFRDLAMSNPSGPGVLKNCFAVVESQFPDADLDG